METIASSEDYKAKEGCTNGILSVRTNPLRVISR
ncbi:MAG: DUF1508 domain-containing protein [Candidatus Bathyarchaeia archaeon]